MSPPLLTLFDEFRRSHSPARVGIDDYQRLIQALQRGYGVEDRAALLRVCKALWAKDTEDQQILDQLFDKHLLPVSETAQSPVSAGVLSLAPTLSAKWVGGLLAVGIGIIAVVGYIAQRQEPPPNPPTVPPGPNDTPTPVTPDPTPSNDPDQPTSSSPMGNAEPLPHWVQGLILVLALVGGGLLLWKLWQWWQGRQPPPPAERPTDDAAATTTLLHDEVEAAQVHQQQGLNRAQMVLVTPDMPATERQMQRSWRYLTRPVREGTPTELDIQGTVQRIGREGFLTDPVLMPPRINRAALLLLVDREGSMEPHHALTDRLVHTAQQGGRFSLTPVYYFHNCPTGYLYRDMECAEGEALETVLERLPLRHLSTLIISDAGAVRGGYNPYRVEKTLEFLAALRQQVRDLAWLNPQPRLDWEGTTAAAIANHIPMFSCTRTDLDQAVEVLRGRRKRQPMQPLV